MENSNLDPYSANLSDRIVAFEYIWEVREQHLPEAYTSVFKIDDFWDPMLHKEFSSQHGWTRLGNA
jgi:hypothetical protein